MKQIETIGTITKVEELHTVDYNILPNTLVLENREPFPGYYGENQPKDTIPESIFLITKQKYDGEEILRTSQRLMRYFKHPFDATYGEIFAFNAKFNCIRIHYLKSYEYISELQCFYMDEGISFMKKKNVSTSGIIEVHKHFSLDEVEKGIYLDKVESLMTYFQVPVQLKWKLFEQITHSVKNNIDNSNFDAAIGVIYFKEITDIIRVYCKNMDMSRLKNIREYYFKEIKKI